MTKTFQSGHSTTEKLVGYIVQRSTYWELAVFEAKPHMGWLETWQADSREELEQHCKTHEIPFEIL